MSDHQLIHPNLPAPLQKLFDQSSIPDLGPGPRSGVKSVSQLHQDVDSWMANSDLTADSQALIRCALLLWHDHLEPSHEISSSISSPEGSFLHGIMHRREPDYSNAKYWFRRVGDLSIYPELAASVADLLVNEQQSLAQSLLPGGNWDSFAMVDLVEQAVHRTGGSTQQSLMRIQCLEISTLLNFVVAA